MTGEQRRVYWRCVARRAADGSPAGWLCSGVDVTDRALREEHARVAQDRLTRVARLATVGEMAAGVAHEINQPLTAITTYARACARYLEMPQPDFDELREAVREIGAEGLRAGEIIRRLRRMARTDGGEERSLVDVNALIEELRSLLLADARMYDVRLGFKLGGGLPPVLANATQLQQVVLNLVRNAFEALAEIPVGSRIVEIATARTADGDGRNQRHRTMGPASRTAWRTNYSNSSRPPRRPAPGSDWPSAVPWCRLIAVESAPARPQPRGAVFYVRLPVAEESLA